MERDKQEALFEWDPGLKREAVRCDVDGAAELFCACEEGYSYVYPGTQIVFGFRKGILVGKLSGDEDADGRHWQR